MFLILMGSKSVMRHFPDKHDEHNYYSLFKTAIHLLNDKIHEI